MLAHWCLLAVLYISWPTLSQWHAAIPTVDQNKITTAKVIRGELIRNVAVSGKAIAANAPQLYSTEVGKINFVTKPGESVAKGQVVATLASPELDALIKQQESTLEQLTISAKPGFIGRQRVFVRSGK